MFSIWKPMGVPVVAPSKTPDSNRTASGSLRVVPAVPPAGTPPVELLLEQFLREGDAAGQPSTTPPSAGPWDSP